MKTKLQVEGLGPFPQWGFTLEHDGAIALLLLHEGELVTRFSQAGATEKSLKEECARHLVEKHGWDGVLWSRKEALKKMNNCIKPTEPDIPRLKVPKRP